jgi:hypothetical protein
MNRSEINKLLKEASEFEEKSGKRYIPIDVTLTKAVRDMFPGHFALRKSLKTDKPRLYISPLLKVALDAIQRGRTSPETRSKQSGLTGKVLDYIPQDVRALLKKYTEKISTGVKGEEDDEEEGGMFPVRVNIKNITPSKDIIFYSPSNKQTAAQAYDPTIGESIYESLESVDLKEEEYKPVDEISKFFVVRKPEKGMTNKNEMVYEATVFDEIIKEKTVGVYKNKLDAGREATLKLKEFEEQLKEIESAMDEYRNTKKDIDEKKEKARNLILKVK